MASYTALASDVTSNADRSLRDLELSPPPSPRPGRGHRSNSSISGFDFGRLESLVIPLSLSEEQGGTRTEAKKRVGLLDGIALVVGLQVGSGIFSSPGVVLASCGSPGAALAIWLVSGMLAWSGASSFAELGSAIPLNGGAQAYLAYSYGPIVSYLFSWTAVTLLKPGSAAIVALIFGEYLSRLLWHATSPTSNVDVPELAHKVIATLAVILVSAVNLFHARGGTTVQVVLTFVKVCSLIFVAVLGILSLVRHQDSTQLSLANLFQGSSDQAGNYAIALYSGLWAFDGWDQANYVAGEMIDVNRDLPRVIHGSMALVTALFTLANVSYFLVLDKQVISESNTVALDYGSAILGPAGGITFSMLVAISCIGALNGSFYTSARLIYTASKEQFLPELFGRLSARRKTPDNAMALQAGLTVCFILFGGGFRTLVNFFSVASWTFYFLTVLGLIILRIKEPHLERPYRTFLGTPLLFCSVALFLLFMPIAAAPWEAVAAFAFILFGIPLYYLTAASRVGQPAGPSAVSHPGPQAPVLDRIRSLGWWKSLLLPSTQQQETSARDYGEESLEMLSPASEDHGMREVR